VPAAEARVQRLQIVLESAAKEVRGADLMASLQRPINVQLKDATLRQASQALSQAAGVSVEVDEQGPADQRGSSGARGVPFSVVLEALARQADLMIARAERGVTLKSWPTLEVNGQKEVLKAPSAPWGEGWAFGLQLGGSGYGAVRPGFAAVPPAQPSP